MFVPLQSGFLLFGNSVIYLQAMLSFFLPVRHIFCLSKHCTGRVCLVYFKIPSKVMKKHLNAETLPPSHLLHVNLYTMSDYAIDMCVCVCVYDMCIYTKPKYIAKMNHE